MSYKVIYDGTYDSVGMSATYGRVMGEILAADKDVYELEADLAGAVSTRDLPKKFPGRALNMGIAEANMVGMGAGLSFMGKKVYMHSFAAFMGRRVMDNVFMTCAFNGQSIRAYGSDEGICSRIHGGTHEGNEDMAAWRPIPGSIVLDLSDNVLFENILWQVKDMEGCIYMRSDRSPRPSVYAPGSTFEIGKANLLKDGTDVTIIAAGIEIKEAMEASELLAKEGISARVVDMFTVKPVDRDMIEKCAKETGAIVVAENHQINGGLCDAVAAALVELYPVPMERVANQDRCGQVGPIEFLLEEYGLDAKTIAAKAKAAIARKK